MHLLPSRGSNMAAGEAVIRDRVISVGISSDVTEIKLKQTTARVIVVGGCG